MEEETVNPFDLGERLAQEVVKMVKEVLDELKNLTEEDRVQVWSGFYRTIHSGE